MKVNMEQNENDNLNLRGLNSALRKICGGDTNAMFYDKKNNNAVIFYSIKRQDPHCSIEDICDCTPDKNYEYIVNLLNNKKDYFVYWVKMPKTTSNYIIYKNLNIKDIISMKYLAAIKYIHQLNLTGKNREEEHDKYMIYNNEVFSKIDF